MEEAWSTCHAKWKISFCSVNLSKQNCSAVKLSCTFLSTGPSQGKAENAWCAAAGKRQRASGDDRPWAGRGRLAKRSSWNGPVMG